MQKLFFPTEASLLDASRLVKWKRHRNAYSFQALPAVCIVANPRFFPRSKPWLRAALRGIPKGCFIHQGKLFYPLEQNGGPHLLSVLEEFRILGVQEILFLGLAGALGETAQERKAYWVKEAGSGSGVTAYYHGRALIAPSPSRLISICNDQLGMEGARCFSLDAPFRETPTLIGQIRDQGFPLIDMETAALYAFSQFYQLPTVSILWAADRIEETWRPPGDLDVLFDAGKSVLHQLIPKL